MLLLRMLACDVFFVLLTLNCLVSLCFLPGGGGGGEGVLPYKSLVDGVAFSRLE